MRYVVISSKDGPTMDHYRPGDRHQALTWEEARQQMIRWHLEQLGHWVRIKQEEWERGAIK